MKMLSVSVSDITEYLPTNHTAYQANALYWDPISRTLALFTHSRREQQGTGAIEGKSQLFSHPSPPPCSLAWCYRLQICLGIQCLQDADRSHGEELQWTGSAREWTSGGGFGQRKSVSGLRLGGRWITRNSLTSSSHLDRHKHCPHQNLLKKSNQIMLENCWFGFFFFLLANCLQASFELSQAAMQH